MRYKIELCYNGTNYHGWQVQPNGITVQESLEKVLSLLLRETISVTGCGRTDSGVHAEYYVAHFDSDKQISANFVNSANGILGDDISLISVAEVASDFHARFDAKRRTYKYIICKRKNPFWKAFSWQLRYNLDVEKMQEAANKLFDYKDFTSFSKLHTDVKTNNCQIYEARFEKNGDLLIFWISADRFLRNMVRAVVGTLVEVGKGRLTVDEFCSIIEQKNRCSAGQSVPAQGLFLVGVEY